MGGLHVKKKIDEKREKKGRRLEEEAEWISKVVCSKE